MNQAEVNAMIEKENQKYQDHFVDLPKSEWLPKTAHMSVVPFRVARNRRFVVQLSKHDGAIKITVNRTAIDESGRWEENITWDELQSIKDSLGYQDFDAVEVFPKTKDIVNVANMRHLWVLTKHDLKFIWRKERQ